MSACKLWSKMKHEWGRDWDYTRYRAVYLGSFAHLFKRYKSHITISLDLISKPQFFPGAPKQLMAKCYAKNGILIEQWLNENLKGKCHIDAIGDNMGGMEFSFESWTDTLVMHLSFTDPREATYFKVTFG